MSTRAIDFLKHKGIAHQVVSYEPDEKGAAFAAQAVGFPLSQTIKTLVVALDSAGFALALMPGDCQLSLKKAAAAGQAKRAAMAAPQTAERLTGCQVGGISPFGVQKRMLVIMEIALSRYKEVLINAGQRGMLLKMTPGDIAGVLEARLVDLILHNRRTR